MQPIEFFWRSAAAHADSIAVIDSERQVSFRELALEVAALASAFQALDPIVGSRIAIGASNSYRHLVALLAVLASGKTWVPLNPRSGTPDLRRLVEITAPGILVLDEAMMQRLAGCASVVVSLEGHDRRSLAGLRAHHAGTYPQSLGRPLDSAQAIKFTGGTTGSPKGVMQPLRAWNTMIVSQLRAFGFDGKDRFVVSAPLTHGSSTYVLPILGVGGCLIIPEETKAAAILDAIERHAATTLFLPPILIQALIRENEIRRRDTTSLRRIIYGAAPMAAERIAEAQNALGPILATTYGQTEAPQIVTFLGPADLGRSENLSSVGRPSFLTTVRIAGPDGSPAAPNCEGEVLVRGDLMMSGYWQAPEKTAATIVDGWLRTGDIGHLDERGFLFLKGRKDDVIITGGFNVHPADVEAVLARHPDVLDCIVVGVPDEKWGEAVHAAIVPRPGCTPNQGEVIGFLKSEIGSVMAPKVIHLFDQLPKTAVDKISRAELRKEIARRKNETVQGR